MSPGNEEEEVLEVFGCRSLMDDNHSSSRLPKPTQRLGVLLVAALASTPAAATVYLVTPDGTGDFPTIQAAIDAAADGDVIELDDGVFTGEGNGDLDFLGRPSP